ncbi:MAG: hypothetical protein DLM69_06580, partial [Candidatus Chloroheliales bacterium]
MNDTPASPTMLANRRGLARLLIFLLYLLFTIAMLVSILQVPAAISIGASKQEATLGNFYPTEHRGQLDYRWTKEVS